MLLVNTCHKICWHHCRSAVFRDQGRAREAIASVQTLAVIDRCLKPVAITVHGNRIHLRRPGLRSLFPFSGGVIGSSRRANNANTHIDDLGGASTIFIAIPHVVASVELVDEIWAIGTISLNDWPT